MVNTASDCGHFFVHAAFVHNVVENSQANGKSQAPASTESANRMQTRLNLIVRGLFIGVVRDPAYMELWVPFNSDHKYEWESWGRPIEGAKGPVALTRGMVHELKGLIGGPLPTVEDLEPSVHAVLKNVELNDQRLYAKIRLPYPRKIWALRKADSAGESFYERGADVDRHMVGQPDELAEVVVFEYLVEDLEALRIEGRRLAAEPETNTINLHLWLDSVEEQHNSESSTPDEDALRTVMGIEVRQNRAHLCRQGVITPAEPLPHGMRQAQLYTRHERMEFDAQARELHGIQSYEPVEA
jgi:hypothetical protein